MKKYLTQINADKKQKIKDKIVQNRLSNGKYNQRKLAREESLNAKRSN
jgi:hypothetical protein